MILPCTFMCQENGGSIVGKRSLFLGAVFIRVPKGQLIPMPKALPKSLNLIRLLKLKLTLAVINVVKTPSDVENGS